MADRTISQLVEVANPSIDDVLAVVNGGITKRVTIDNAVGASSFSTNRINTLPDAAPGPTQNLLETDQFIVQPIDGTPPKKVRVRNIYPIAASSSTINLTFNNTDRNITASINPGSINQTHLGTGVVQTSAIADGAITELKIDPNAKIGGATGAGLDKVFYLNDQAVTTNFTVPAGQNAMSAGPITINAGVTVTVPPGCTWTVV